MKKTTEIEYYQTKLIVTGDYESPVLGVMYDSDLTGEKSEPSSFQVIKVETEGGDNITKIFYETQLEDIELLCLDNLDN